MSGSVGWWLGFSLVGCSLFLVFLGLWPCPAHPFSRLCDLSMCFAPRNLKRVAKELGERMTDEELQVVIDGGTGSVRAHWLEQNWSAESYVDRKKLKFGIDGEKRRRKDCITLGVCPYFRLHVYSV